MLNNTDFEQSMITSNLFLCMVNTKIINNMVIEFKPFKSDKDIITKMRVNIQDKSLESITLCAVDIAVMNCVLTLISQQHTDNIQFTANDILRVMAGNPLIKATSRKEDIITDSIEKLRKIFIRIDCTDEMLHRKHIRKKQTAIFKSDLLPVKNITMLSGNHLYICDGYELTQIPAIIEYATKCRHVARIKNGYLCLSQMSDTMDNILLKRYLLFKIALIKNKKNNIQNVISLSWHDTKMHCDKGLYNYLGYTRESFNSDQAWRNKKSKLHEKIASLLDEYTKVGLINGYKRGWNNSLNAVLKYIITTTENNAKKLENTESRKNSEWSALNLDALDIFCDD